MQAAARTVAGVSSASPEQPLDPRRPLGHRADVHVLQTSGLGGRDHPVCEYFVVCERPADGVVHHPVAGTVPTCRRCADLAGAVLEPVEQLSAAS